ncbi:hypothetical protein FLP10_05880 [Agromyces intestinalis]|uniref:Uncharacterized protein n=1 Tax=Agromyces intestinalis TaxID=2592652 RepID=A0A5C1YD88_9MICO|nr:hypothetical protein [Agromyces intestinalis]QEO14004.1 hypothetical protein FLP10_05880 [Agromyces intestinalis]
MNEQEHVVTRRPARIALLGAAAAAALVASGTAPAVAADPAPTLADLPADCQGALSIVTADGALETLVVNSTRAPGEVARSESPEGSDTFDFVPRDLVWIGGSGDEEGGHGSYLAVSPTGRLLEVEYRTHLGEPDRLEITDSGQAGGAPLTVAGPYLFSLRTLPTSTTPQGVLWRFEFNGWDEPGVFTNPGTVGNSRQLGAIEQLAAVYGSYTDPIRTLYGSTGDGELLEITVPNDTPKSHTVRTVAAEGFDDLTSLEVRNCYESGGRTFTGTTDDGAVVVWYDADRTDGIAGADLVRIETGATLEPGDHAFGY